MSTQPNEINDDEIRIITADSPDIPKPKNRFLRVYLPVTIGVILLITLILVLLVLCMPKAAPPHEGFDDAEYKALSLKQAMEAPREAPVEAAGAVTVVDTVVNGNPLLILFPENATPRLAIGSEVLDNPNIILLNQAADIRGDNGKIAGSFVLNGELISKGEAKAGFCSIINGKITIGIADATPMLERALTEGGYFFRQYPLVVGGQIIENKPKGRAVRKALAELGGKICMVISKNRLTFHDFSQLLVDTGVSNAIYLVGSSSSGFYKNDMGDRVFIGSPPWEDIENINYILWE